MNTIAPSFPPHRLQHATPISPAEALIHLQAFLADAAENPHLQPGSLLSETGPRPSATSSSGNLALHNLRRIEAGLRGEHLAAELALDGLGDGDEAAAGDIEMGGTISEIEREQGWEDLQTYQRGLEDDVDGEEVA